MMTKIRHNREKLLIMALDVLAHEGKVKITIEYLSKKLGVTKGSFYSHFQSRKDFTSSVAEYWTETSTIDAIGLVSKNNRNSQEKLLVLMEMIRTRNLESCDTVMRAWSLDEPLVAEQVEKVDRARYEFVKSLFAEIGFTGEELEMRTMVFQVYHSFGSALLGSFFKEQRLKHESLRHLFFTRKMEEES